MTSLELSLRVRDLERGCDAYEIRLRKLEEQIKSAVAMLADLMIRVETIQETHDVHAT